MIKQLRITSKDTGRSFDFYTVEELNTWLKRWSIDTTRFTLTYRNKRDNWLNNLIDCFTCCGLPTTEERIAKRSNQYDWNPVQYLIDGSKNGYELLKLTAEPLHGSLRHYIQPQHLKAINEQAHREAGLI